MRFAYSQVENLNEAEMCVYNYIVKNLKHILNLSVRELADEVHVSTATVMRFCKKMGYSGFSELKYKIKEFYEQQDQADNYEINVMSSMVLPPSVHVPLTRLPSHQVPAPTPHIYQSAYFHN